MLLLIMITRNKKSLFGKNKCLCDKTIYISLMAVLKHQVFFGLENRDPKGFQSSNLCASAGLNKGLPKGNPFVLGARNKKEYPVPSFA